MSESLNVYSIVAETVPAPELRYPTAGDWVIHEPELQVTVADLGDPDMNFCLMIHEIVEGYLANKSGISGAEVDQFDLSHPEDDDPGLLALAPYHKQHMVAYAVEILIAQQLGIDWLEYCDKVSAAFELSKTKQKMTTDAQESDRR